MKASAEPTPSMPPRAVTGEAAPLASAPHAHGARAGLVYALGAYLAWGVVPSYFKLLAHVPPLVVLAHRVVWSVVFLLFLLISQRNWGEVRQAVRNPRTLALLGASTVMIA